MTPAQAKRTIAAAGHQTGGVMAERTYNWAGQSGKEYAYQVYKVGQRLGRTPGNYMFAREADSGFLPIYVGQTSDLSERFDGHHKIDCIRANGATHLHAHASSRDEDVRRKEEADIKIAQEPPCND